MKLKYRIIGEGQPVMIFHGLFGMSDNWQSFAKQLAEDGFQVILVDLRNHGHSPHDDHHSYPLIAADIAELINDLSLSNPIVIGHSMGGKSVLQLINDFPSITAKVIVIDIAPYMYPIHHREILDTLLSIDLNVIKKRSEAEKILGENIDDLGTRQFLLKNLYWIHGDQLAWRFNLKAINDNIDEIGAPTWPLTPNLTPVLFLKGSLSGYIDDSRLNEIKQWYPNAIFKTIEGAGHWVHADRPKELLEVVEEFIANNNTSNK